MASSTAGLSRIPRPSEWAALGLTRETLPDWVFANLDRKAYDDFMAGRRDAVR